MGNTKLVDAVRIQEEKPKSADSDSLAAHSDKAGGAKAEALVRGANAPAEIVQSNGGKSKSAFAVLQDLMQGKPDLSRWERCDLDAPLYSKQAVQPPAGSEMPEKRGYKAEFVGVNSDGVYFGNFRSEIESSAPRQQNVVPFICTFSSQGKCNIEERPVRKIYHAAYEGGPRLYDVTEFLGMSKENGRISSDIVVARTPYYGNYNPGKNAVGGFAYVQAER